MRRQTRTTPRFDGFRGVPALVQSAVYFVVVVVLLLASPDASSVWPLCLLGSSVIGLNVSMLVKPRLGDVLTLIASSALIASVILLEQAIEGYYGSWAYSWPLVLPGALGVGVLLRNATWQTPSWRPGLWLALSGVLAWLTGLVLFEGVIGLSGTARPTLVKTGIWVFFLALSLLFLTSWLASKINAHQIKDS
jgi:hypothetical protein